MARHALAFIPARGGSKSIPLKNLARLGGRTLLEYAVTAAKSSCRIAEVICSTDNDEIAAEAERLGAKVDHRPVELGRDDTNVLDVLKEYILRSHATPTVAVLFQPTNPFVRGSDVEKILDALFGAPHAKTAQTVAKVPHNYHAWNQREFKDGEISFRWKEERAGAYDKQKKPPLFKFGNLVAVRVEALPTMREFFEQPSVGVEIEPPYDLDVDGPTDLLLGEALVNSKLVDLDGW